MKNVLYGLIVIYFFSIQPTLAQDGHYWTQQYGTNSILLSNAAIGGVKDLAAVYYNPGRMGLIEKPAFLLNTSVFEISRLQFSNIVGQDRERTRTQIVKVPSFVAVNFRLKFLEDHKFAVSLIQRQDIDIDFNYRSEIVDDVFDNNPGQETLSTNLGLKQKVKEEWISLTWSYPFNEKVSVGVTTSLARLRVNKGTLIELQGLTELDQVAQYQFDRGYQFNDLGLLWKFGFAGGNNTFDWGVTLTTPSIQIGGQGIYDYYEFFSGIEGVTVNPDNYITSHQEEIEITYKRPLAIGAGLSFPVGKSSLYISGEWYNAIPRYTLMQAEDHISQTSSGETISFTLVDDLQSVTNFGIGAEIYINQKLSTYLSMSSDFSAVRDNPIAFSDTKPIANNSVFTADYFHFATGVSFSLKQADVTLGVAYTGGKQDFDRPSDFPDNNNPIISESSTFDWDRIRVLFSFAIPFSGGNAENSVID